MASMRILVHFAAERVSDHLQQIAWEIDRGRTFGVGWCPSLGGRAPSLRTIVNARHARAMFHFAKNLLQQDRICRSLIDGGL